MQRKSVLVVDDDPQIVKALGECLEGFDYGMKVATNGAEALLKMADPELSLVLLDVNLPDYSGLDILNKIKESNANLPVIIMTGFVSTVFGAAMPWMLSLQYLAIVLAFAFGLYVIRTGLILEPPAFLVRWLHALTERITSRFATS